MTETWKSVVDGAYEISSEGRLRRAVAGRRTWPGRVLSLLKLRNGYLGARPVVNGRNIQMYAHELVALAFLGPRAPGLVINHIDGNKHNNAVSNLEYVSHAQNMAHAARVGLSARGERQGSARLTERDVLEIRRMRAEGIGLPAICSRFGIARSTASQIASGQRWRHI